MTPPSMHPIPDFTDAERRLVSDLLLKRYGKPVELRLADSDLQLGADPEQLTSCPTLYWNERGAHFIVCKTGGSRYRSQFFYSETEQYGTGRDEYDGLESCIVTLLQVQSDHERELAKVSSGATAASLNKDDYQGPVIV